MAGNPAPFSADALLAGIAGGVIAFDADWRCVRVNPAAARLLGCDARALEGSLIGAVLDGAAAEAAAAAAAPLALSLPGPEPEQWLELRGEPHPGGYAFFLRDVGEERRAHLAHARADAAAVNAINQRIFDTTLDLILVVDRQGNFLRVSPSVFDILGYRFAELIGRNAIDFLYPPDLERTRDEMRTARRTGLMRFFECRYVHKAGRVVTLEWTGVWNGAVDQHCFIGRDITERLATEERLRHAQRLEALGQLTGGMAHDFNNLLGIVIGNLDLAGPMLPPGTAGELVAEALRAAGSGADLVRRLLAFARRQPLRPEPIDVNVLVAQMTKLLERTLGEQIAVSLELAPGLGTVVADAAQLETSIANLATNARDAMPDGGRLVICTKAEELDADDASAREVAPGDYAVIEVTDTGTGMPPEVAQHIFEPFFTTKERGKGTGLGLSMVFGFLKQSGGHVSVYSELGLGTTFRLYLPRTPDAVPKPEPPPPSSSPAEGERVLAVEDNPGMRRILLRQLGDLGYRAAAVATADEALDHLGRLPVDLLITDIVLAQGIDGFELARRAMARWPHLRIVLTSGFPEAKGGTAAGEDLKLPLLGKPYRKADLAQLLRQVLEG